MKKFLCLLSAVAFVFTSCSKDDDNSSNSILVKKITEYQNGEPVTIDYLYDGNKLVSNTYYDGSQMKYTYAGNLITKIEEIDASGDLESTSEFVYTNGKLTSFVERLLGDSNEYKTEYTYNNDGTISYKQFKIDIETKTEDSDYNRTGKLTYVNGNLTKAERSSVNSTSVETYEYDVKNSPFKNVTGFSKLLDEESQNNIVKSTSTSGTGTNVYTYETTYTYKYDANGYPTEKVATFPNGTSTSTETTNYTY